MDYCVCDGGDHNSMKAQHARSMACVWGENDQGVTIVSI